MDRPLLTVEIQERLADHENAGVRQAAANNPNYHSPFLEKLAGDDEFNVRYCVAINPNTPVQVLKQLERDHEEYICNAAMWNQGRLRGHF